MFNERLKKLREEKGWSQTEVANRLKISRSQYSNYEQGIRQPDYDTLNRIAVLFDCSTDYLLGRSNLTLEQDRLVKDLENNISFEELQKKYNLTIDDKVASEEEIKAVIAFVRSLRGLN